MNEQLESLYLEYSKTNDVTREMFLNTYNALGAEYISMVEDEINSVKKKEDTQPINQTPTPTGDVNTPILNQEENLNVSVPLSNDLQLNQEQQQLIQPTQNNGVSSSELQLPLETTTTASELVGANQDSLSASQEPKPTQKLKDFKTYQSELNNLKNQFTKYESELKKNPLLIEQDKIELNIKNLNSQIKSIEEDETFKQKYFKEQDLIKRINELTKTAVDKKLPQLEFNLYKNYDNELNKLNLDADYKNKSNKLNELYALRNSDATRFNEINENAEVKDLISKYNTSLDSYKSIANSNEYKKSFEDYKKNNSLINQKTTLDVGTLSSGVKTEKYLETPNGYVDFGNGIQLPKELLPEEKTKEEFNKEIAESAKDVTLKQSGLLEPHDIENPKWINRVIQGSHGEKYVNSILQDEKEGKVKVARNDKGELIDEFLKPILDKSNVLWQPVGSYINVYNNLVKEVNKEIELNNQKVSQNNSLIESQNIRDLFLGKKEEPKSPLTNLYNKIYSDTGILLTEEQKANFKSIDDVYNFYALEKAKKDVKDNPELNYNEEYNKNLNEFNPKITLEQSLNLGNKFVNSFLLGFQLEEEKIFAEARGYGAKIDNSYKKGYASDKDKDEIDFIKNLSNNQVGLSLLGQWWNSVGQKEIGTSNYKINAVLSTKEGRADVINSIVNFVNGKGNLEKELANENIVREKFKNLNNAKLGNTEALKNSINYIQSESKKINDIETQQKEVYSFIDEWKGKQVRQNEVEQEFSKTFSGYQKGDVLPSIKFIAGNTINGISDAFKSTIGGVAQLPNLAIGSDEYNDVIGQITKPTEFFGVKTSGMFSKYYDYESNGKKIRFQNGNYYEVDKNGGYKPIDLTYTQIAGLGKAKEGEEFSIAGMFGDTTRMATEMALAEFTGGLALKGLSKFSQLRNIPKVASVFGEESALTTSLQRLERFSTNPTNNGYFGWFTQTVADNYQEGKSKGMTNTQAAVYGSVQSLLTSFLSRINPDVKFFKLYKELDEKLIGSILKNDKQGFLNGLKSMTNQIGSQIVGEEGQELTEQLAQEVVKQFTNTQLSDKKFDKMTSDDVLKTIITTAVTTGALSSANIATRGNVDNVIEYDNAYYNSTQLSNGQKLVMLANLNTAEIFKNFERQFITDKSKLSEVEKSVSLIKNYLDKIPNKEQYTLNTQTKAVSLLYEIDKKRKQLNQSDEVFKPEVQTEIDNLSGQLKELLDSDIKLQEEVKNNTLVDEQPQTKPQQQQKQEGVQGQTTETNVQPEQTTIATEQGVSIDLNAKTGDTLYKPTEQSVPTDIEAKKADIERRRKEELDDFNSPFNLGAKIEVKDEKGNLISNNVDNINAKYDAELKGLENNAPTSETKQTTQPIENQKVISANLDNYNEQISTTKNNIENTKNEIAQLETEIKNETTNNIVKEYGSKIDKNEINSEIKIINEKLSFLKNKEEYDAEINKNEIQRQEALNELDNKYKGNFIKLNYKKEKQKINERFDLVNNELNNDLNTKNAIFSTEPEFFDTKSSLEKRLSELEGGLNNENSFNLQELKKQKENKEKYLSSLEEDLKLIEKNKSKENQKEEQPSQEPTQQEEITTAKEFEKLDLATELGINKVISILDDAEKKLDQFSKETLGISLPIAVTKGAIQAMKAAAKTVKAGADVLSVGINYVRNTDWYKNQTKEEQDKINNEFLFNQIISLQEKTQKQQKAKVAKIENIKDRNYWRKQALNSIKLILNDKTINDKITPNEINRLIKLSEKLATVKDINQYFDEFGEKVDKIIEDAEKRLSTKEKLQAQKEQLKAKEVAKIENYKNKINDIKSKFKNKLDEIQKEKKEEKIVKKAEKDLIDSTIATAKAFLKENKLQGLIRPIEVTSLFNSLNELYTKKDKNKALNDFFDNVERILEKATSREDKLNDLIVDIKEKSKAKIKELKDEYREVKKELDKEKNAKIRLAEKIYWRRQAVNEIKLILRSKSLRDGITNNDLLRLLKSADKILSARKINDAFDDFEVLLDKILSKKTNRELAEKEKYDNIYNNVEEKISLGISLEEILSEYSDTNSKLRAETAYYEIKGKQITPEQAMQMMEDINKREDEMLRPKTTIKEVIKKATKGFNQKVVDRQYLPKKYLEKIGAMNTLNRLVNFGGAASVAKRAWDKAYNKIYLGLPENEVITLNNVIQNMRIISIANNREQRGLPAIKSTVANITIDINGKKISQNQMQTKDTAQAYLEGLRQKIGDKKFKDYEKRANAYFGEFKGLLDKLLDAGMIRQEAYDAMYSIDYQPRIFLQHLLDYENKIPQQEKNFRSKNNGLTKDLIRLLENGSEGVLLSNSQLLLASAIASRTQSIMMNEINKVFITKEYPEKKIKFEKIDPKNFKDEEEKRFYKYFKELDEKLVIPLTDTIEARNGYTKAYYFEDGVRKEFLMEDELHTLWNDKLKKVTPDWVGLLGPNLFKSLATGYNPAFILVNTPRDFLNILAFSPEYAGFAKPIEAGKLIYDTGKAWLSIYRNNRGKENIVEKYFEYGGGMDFLNTQGMLTNTKGAKRVYEATARRLGKVLPEAMPKLSYDAFSKVLYYMSFKFASNYSELGFRVANFTRAINNQLEAYNKANKTNYKTIDQLIDAENKVEANRGDEIAKNIYNQAVTSSRELLDFNQGGTLAKEAESFVPYINAGIQGTRVAVRALKKDPANFVNSVFQLSVMSGSAMYGLGLMIMSIIRPDDEKDNIENYLDFRSTLSPTVRRNYFAIPTKYDAIDNKYTYIQIAKTQSMTPFLTVTEGVMDNFLKLQVGKEEISFKEIITDAWRAMANTVTDKGDKTIRNSFDAMSNNIDPTNLTTLFTTEGDLATKTRETFGKVASRLPLMKAAFTAWSGHDFYFDQPLSPDIGRFQSPLEGQNDKKVEQFYKDLALKTGYSPVRTKAFVESLITSPNTNLFVGFFYAGADIITTDVDFKDGMKDFLGYNKEKQRFVFNEIPAINRIMRESSDFTRTLNSMDKNVDKEELNNLLYEGGELLVNSTKIANKYLRPLREAKTDQEIAEIYNKAMDEAEKFAIENYGDDVFDQKTLLTKVSNKLQNFNIDGTAWDIKEESKGIKKVQALLIYGFYKDKALTDGNIQNSLKEAGVWSDETILYYQDRVRIENEKKK